MNDRSLPDRYGLPFLGTVVAVVLIWFVTGWWTKPPAVEFDNLRYIQLLSTAVSSRKPEMVEKVAEAVRRRHAESRMSPQELEHFEDILGTARSGRWEEADRQAYAFAEAQLSRKRTAAPSAGHDHRH